MKREALIIVGLIAITLAAFWGVGHCGFVMFDDPEYVINNFHVYRGLSIANFSWAWKTFYDGNYLPLTWLSLMLNVTLLGTGPSGFHRVNLALHIANAIFVYLFFRYATGAVWRSALVAAIFTVHPLRVESVVWIVERKDVLSGFFGLLAMLAYLQFARKPKWTSYAATLFLFAASLLAKQTFATLPFVLLLLDYWPLGRWDNGPVAVQPGIFTRRPLLQLVVEKLSLLAVVVIILAATVRAQGIAGSISTLQSDPMGWRLANAVVSYARYLGKMFWFRDLAIFYPPHPWGKIQIAGACLLLAASTLICICRLRSSPWLIVGWLWFLGVLFPMIGIVQCGPQAMADRFTYISGIGLLIMLAWSIPATAWLRPVSTVVLAGTALVLLVFFTTVQIRYWRNSVTLFTHDIRVAGTSFAFELNLGAALFERNQLPEAIGHFRNAVRLNPRDATAQGNLAVALATNHQDAEAIAHGIAAVYCDPENTKRHVDLAFVFTQAKRYEEAVQECKKAIGLNPRSAQAHRLLGIALSETGNRKDGIAQFELAIAIDPELRQARLDLQQYQDAAIPK